MKFAGGIHGIRSFRSSGGRRVILKGLKPKYP